MYSHKKNVKGKYGSQHNDKDAISKYNIDLKKKKKKKKKKK